MDESAPLTVAKGTFFTSVTTAALAGIYGAFKGQAQLSPGALAVSAALNGGITAATFFSFREYVISPALVTTLPGAQYSYRRRELGLESRLGDNNFAGRSLQNPLTWYDLRSYNLLDSGISGALTGGLLNAWKRGRSGIIPGFTTGAVVCASLQFVYNEIGIARIRYISQKTQESRVLSKVEPSPHSWRPLPEPAKPFLERMLDRLGFHRVSDDEYLSRMKRTRDGYLSRIQELERKSEDIVSESSDGP